MRRSAIVVLRWWFLVLLSLATKKALGALSSEDSSIDLSLESDDKRATYDVVYIPIGDPAVGMQRLELSAFMQWKYGMRSHCMASTRHLWPEIVAARDSLVSPDFRSDQNTHTQQKKTIARWFPRHNYWVVKSHQFNKEPAGLMIYARSFLIAVHALILKARVVKWWISSPHASELRKTCPGFSVASQNPVYCGPVPFAYDPQLWWWVFWSGELTHVSGCALSSG